MEPKKGLLTFRAEGNNIPNNRYYSRKIHWPGNSFECKKHLSGVTIGRGYDMKYRSKTKIISHLKRAGVSSEEAEKIAEASMKSSYSARDFVRDNKDQIKEITEQQEVAMFEIVYEEYVTDSERFYNKYKKKTQSPGKNCTPY